MKHASSYARIVLESVLRPYAQILFSKDLSVGTLALLAILCFPQLALATLGAVALAQMTALLLGLGTASLRSGSVACTAILTTLATVAFAPGGGHPIALVVIGAIISVFYYTSFEAVFAPVALPTHSLPFVVSAWTVQLIARSLPTSVVPMDWSVSWSQIPVSLFEQSWLDIPASIAFLHGSIAGVLILTAIAVHSRIGVFLAVLGALVAFGMRRLLRSEVQWSAVDTTAAFNAVLAAMAIGGVWFVPQPSSIILGATSSAIAVALTYALYPATSLLYLPLLSLPFVVTTHLILTAARRRQQDRRPRSTVPSERPEESLAKHLMGIRRFGDVAWLPFRLPFRGEWAVSQGHDGQHTHKGLWRHGLDFEGRGLDGLSFSKEGKELRDYHCFGLPVVAAGTGTVAHVVDGIVDNRPGEQNTRENWGNAVVIAHGASLYSVYAHLQNRSIKLRVGDIVGAGTEIGKCGNSGRSPTPHLHFQLQQAVALGSATISADFGDVVEKKSDHFQLSNRVVPTEGSVVRALIRDESLAKALIFVPGSRYEIKAKKAERIEIAEVQIDLWGRRVLQSEFARLYLDAYEAGLVIVDFQGKSASLLRYILLALARTPFDQAQSLRWTDTISRRFFMPNWLRVAADLATVVAPDVGSLEVQYESRREEGKVVICGTAKNWKTCATLSLGGDPHRIAVEHDGENEEIEIRQIEAQELEPAR